MTQRLITPRQLASAFGVGLDEVDVWLEAGAPHVEQGDIVRGHPGCLYLRHDDTLLLIDRDVPDYATRRELRRQPLFLWSEIAWWVRARGYQLALQCTADEIPVRIDEAATTQDVDQLAWDVTELRMAGAISRRQANEWHGFLLRLRPHLAREQQLGDWLDDEGRGAA